MNAAMSVSEETLRILAVLPQASIVIAPGSDALFWSDRAEALGIVARGSVMIPEIARLIERASAESGTVEQEMRVRRPPLGREFLELRVRVAPLGPDTVLVLIDDLAEERRVEAVRRDFVANVSHELKLSLIHI